MSDWVKSVDSHADSPATKKEFKILGVKNIIFYTADLIEIYLERGDIDFCPGDYVSIYGEDINISREYSIASGINDPYLGFLIKHIPGGVVTEFLYHRKKGDSIRISLPEGSFRPGLQHGNDDFIFIATGTGIAPFLSYIKTHPQKPPKNLLYGVRILKEAVGKDIFTRVCPTELAISRERIKGFCSGHVTDLLDHLDFSARTHFYLCGLDAMIADVSKWLTERNVQSDHIHHEIFFHALSSKK